MIREAQLTLIRLTARHTGEPLSPEYLDYATEELLVPERDVRTAYQEGLDARSSGMPCLCGNCGATEIREKETLRIQYSLKRQAELESQGRSAAEVAQIIEAEIARGAALKGQYHEESEK